jgi:hypothetical protein
MKRRISYLFVGALFLVACSTSKKVQVINDALNQKDTSTNQLLTEKTKVDSGAIVSEIFNKIAATKLNYNTLNAKLKVDYETVDKSDAFMANVSINKGKGIFIIVKGPMGVIGLKAIITNDSVFLFYPLNKKLDKRPLAYLQNIIKIPFSYTTIEDLIVGNPVFMDNANIASYKTNNNKLQIGLMGQLFKNLISLNEDNTKVLHLKLDDIDLNKHRTCDITYSNHTTALENQFPLNRDIAIASQSRFEIHIEVKEFAFNEPLKYNFDLPKPGKRR